MEGSSVTPSRGDPEVTTHASTDMPFRECGGGGEDPLPGRPQGCRLVPLGQCSAATMGVHRGVA